MDWQAVLDLKRAAANCHFDMLGDWYRDPWGWHEIAWAVSKRPELVVSRLNGSGVRRVSKIDVPKENFATRPAIVMDPIDRLAYQALVDVSSSALIGDLRPWVFGWRLGRKKPATGSYMPNAEEWENYRSRLQSLAQTYPFGLETDIVSCFASIPIERLCDDIVTKARNDVTMRLTDMLRGWSRVPGRTGLPQRSMASAALANMYLGPLDDTIEAIAAPASKKVPFPGAVRWMDDISVFGSDAGAMRGAQLRLEARMRDMGVNMGAAKTRVLSGADLLASVNKVEHSAVDASLAAMPADPEPLASLIAELVEAPEAASRTSIRFAATRIRSAKQWHLVDVLRPYAPRMPQGADHLARLFKDSGTWKDMGDWYVEYCGSPWGALEWSVAQLATMFPTKEKPPDSVVTLFRQFLQERRSLPLVAVAAQRLASWQPNPSREVLRDAAARATDPLERRVLALALVVAGEERHAIRAFLGEYEENEVTLLMLADRRFRPPPISGDYG